MIESFFNRTGYIYRITRASDDFGSTDETRTLHLTLSCSRRPLRPDETEQYDRESSAKIDRFYFLGSPDIREDDEIVESEATYRILSITNPGGRNEFVQVDAVKIVR